MSGKCIKRIVFFVCILLLIIPLACNLPSSENTTNGNQAGGIDQNPDSSNGSGNAGWQSDDEIVEPPTSSEADTGEEPLPPQGNGRTYYVSPHGDNSNDGSLESPWATPGFASRQLQPGDTLIILGGKYLLREYDDDILMPSTGREDAWITIRGETNTRPVLAGGDDLAAAISLSGVNYLRIENLEITHDDDARGEGLHFRDGILIQEDPSSNIVLKNLYIHHIDEFGINAQDVDGLEILDSRIEYTGFGAIGGPAGNEGGLRNLHISGCSLSYAGHYYQGGDGSNRPYDRPDGFGIEASDGPILIEDSIAAHNYGDGLDSKAANTIIRRSIVANNACDGIKLWGDKSRVENTLIYGRGDGNSEETPWAAIVIGTETANASFELVHVTVDDVLGGNYLMYVQYDTPGVPVQLTIVNSIFRGVGDNSPIYIGEASTLIVHHNLFYIPNSDTVLIHGEQTINASEIQNLGEKNTFADPLFVEPGWGSEGDYHLQPDSPAVDAGSADEILPVDLFGTQRQSPPDLGAIEMDD